MNASPVSDEYVLRLSCTDAVGIVHAIAGALVAYGASITESQQYGDPVTRRFFMRVQFDVPGGAGKVDALRGELAAVAERFAMDWEVHRCGQPTRTIVMVSKFGHCLNELLYRHATGTVPIDLVGVVSNHRDFAALCESYGIPFHHVPVSATTKDAAEARLLGLVDEHDVELVVLARYMQVLSAGVCERLAGRVINIHHSFLPSFKGARPYQQAHDRGVKLIGATAHYVTTDLDEGPIIEQEVVRVDHSFGVDGLTAAGRDAESRALVRAVEWHAEGRILLNGVRTVVFR